MAAIKAKNTKPELLVRKFLYSHGLRYRLFRKDLPGKPDVVFSGKKIVIFVNGCFWHAHKDCNTFRLPKSRTEWWKEKLEGNRRRDLKNYALLEEKGWHVEIVWECEMSEKRLKLLVDRVVNA